VSFPKDDPNHYALYRLFIIARFCAPPFPDALVETSRQRPSPAPEISGRDTRSMRWACRWVPHRPSCPICHSGWTPTSSRWSRFDLIQRSGRQSRRAGQVSLPSLWLCSIASRTYW